jgi:peptidyl-prolyl cis-trans isomerase A (cyclophilin A)
MILRFALFAALLATPAIAQDVPAPPPPAPVTKPATVRVTLTTTEGPIVLELEKERAPVTTANFLRYVDAKRFDGIAFFRAMKLSWGGLIQAGVRDARKLYPPIAHEPTTQTGLSHVEGAISMARMEPGTATGDFTIMVGDMTGLDANSKGTGDTAGYAVFGHVAEGMDVVKRILDAPTSPTLGEGVMKGQIIADPVKILTARRIPSPTP